MASKVRRDTDICIRPSLGLPFDGMMAEDCGEQRRPREYPAGDPLCVMERSWAPDHRAASGGGRRPTGRPGSATATRPGPAAIADGTGRVRRAWRATARAVAPGLAGRRLFGIGRLRVGPAVVTRHGRAGDYVEIERGGVHASLLRVGRPLHRRREFRSGKSRNTKAALVGRLRGLAQCCTILGRRTVPAVPKSCGGASIGAMARLVARRPGASSPPRRSPVTRLLDGMDNLRTDPHALARNPHAGRPPRHISLTELKSMDRTLPLRGRSASAHDHDSGELSP